MNKATACMWRDLIGTSLNLKNAYGSSDELLVTDGDGYLCGCADLDFVICERLYDVIITA